MDLKFITTAHAFVEKIHVPSDSEGPLHLQRYRVHNITLLC